MDKKHQLIRLLESLSIKELTAAQKIMDEIWLKKHQKFMRDLM